MKKLVAISVLFALLATAVFAQDGGWSNEWKVGFSAKFITDMFFAGKVTQSTEQSKETDPAQLSTDTSDQKARVTAQAAQADAAYAKSIVEGKNGKGVAHFFPNSRPTGIGGDERLEISLENSGENYSVWGNIAMDRSNPNSPTVDWLGHDWNLLKNLIDNGRMLTDFGIKGVAGIFQVGLGSKPSDTGWVGTNATWGSWYESNDLNRFGVWSKKDGWIHSDHFRTMEQWGEVLAVSIKPVDNYQVAFGYMFLNGWNVWAPSTSFGIDDSKSSINGAFMLSGSPVDMINFDLFYAVIGQDENTYSIELPASGYGYTDPKGSWKNLIGAYVQVNGIENLALSFGYTASFTAYEAGGYLKPNGDVTQIDKVAYVSPVYSGVDLRLGFSGIDKIGLKFLTNVSFAGVTGDKVDTNEYNSKINLLFDESPSTARTGGAGKAQDWFGWKSVLQANLGFIDGVGLEFVLGDNLSVDTDKINTSETVPGAVTGYSTTTKINNKKTTTTNQLRATLGASYGIGNVSLGIALYFSWENKTTETDYTTTTSYTRPAGTGTMTDSTVKTTSKISNDEVKFGIPITFQVSF